MRTTSLMACSLYLTLSLCSASHAAPLRVVTFNILGGLNEPGSASFEDVAAILGRIDADVIALQELQNDSTNLQALATRLDLNHVYYEGSGSMRNGILSIYPFKRRIPVYEFGMTRPILLAEIDMPNSLIDPWVAALHLKCCDDSLTGSEQRTRAIELYWLKQAIISQVPANAPVMIMGDFNLVSLTDRTFFDAFVPSYPDPLEAPADADGYFPELGIFKMDARHAGDGGENWTWRGNFQFPESDLDHIMVNEVIRARPHAVEIFDLDKDRLGITGLPKNGLPLSMATGSGSDHLPVFADVDVESFPADLSGLTYDHLNSNTVVISWQPATDADSYNVVIDSILYTNTTDTEFMQTFSQAGVYIVTVIPTNHLGEGLGQTITIITGAEPFALSVEAELFAFNANHEFTGLAGWALDDDIAWSNQLTGVTGIFPARSLWTVALPLAVGSNTIVFKASYPGNTLTLSAADDATNTPYVTTSVNAWQTGQSGGYGFKPWILSATANSGHFIANDPLNLDTRQPYAFGLWANNNGLSKARRDLEKPLSRYETLSLELDINLVDQTGVAGLIVLDDTDQPLLSLYGKTTNLFITINGDTSIIPATFDGIDLVIRMLSATSAEVTLIRSETSEQMGTPFNINLPAGRQLSGIEFYNASAGPGPDYDFFIGQMNILAPELEYVSFGPLEVVHIDTTDSDGDGLPDGVETGTGIYLGGYNTGTDPNNPDSSGDGILDGEAAAAGLDPNQDYRLIVDTIAAGAAATPGRFGLYTESAIMDMNMGGIMLRADGTNALLEFQIETSEDIQQWQSYGTAPVLIPMLQDKRFIRIAPPPP